MSGCKMVNGVCCQYCIKFEQDSCPVTTASPWSRYGNFCNAYEPNPKEPQARQLPLKWIMNEDAGKDNKEKVAMNEPFWMVWCFERQAPSKRHTTEQSAIDEAQRLTEKERKTFYVLKCIGEAVPPKPPPVVWVKYAEPTPCNDPTIERAYEQYKKQAENERLVTF